MNSLIYEMNHKEGNLLRIHIVKPGDSLWLISNRYGVPIEEIVRLNGLQEVPYLIPGQAILIPSKTSTNSKKLRTVEANGYILPSTKEHEDEIISNVNLTYISPFSYQVTIDGDLIPLNDDNILETSKEAGFTPILVITNIRNKNFNANLAHQILTNESLQEVLFENILKTLTEKGYYGLNIDFERIPPEDRQLYNDFVKKLTDLLHSENYPVTVALVPKPYDITTGAWHGAHDYQALGEIADSVIIMTYDWGWAGGPPMAIAPINQVKSVLNYAVSVIPSEKIMMGIPLYGYDWPLPYIPRGKWARLISHIEALKIAARYGAFIEYDPIAQSPYFKYFDEFGNPHEVWFEDARSFQEKFKLVDLYDLRGVSYWELSLPSPQNWALLESTFDIKKETI